MSTPEDKNDNSADTLPPAAAGTGGAAGAPGAGRVFANYELLEELGRGTMGVVYKARQVSLNRAVALKVVLAGGHASAADLARFRREAEAVARMQHSHIVQIHEVGEAEGWPFFSLEFVEGGSLAQRLDGTPWPAGKAARLVEALAGAVQHAHERNIVHRDLKPGNVLLTADGQPKVADFGLAKWLGQEQGQTQSGAIVGTPSYMAPEQAGGRSKEVGPAADVYALGAILYELLTGRPPFRAETPLDTLMQLVSEEPVPPSRLQPKVPPDLANICLMCLEKKPHKRYNSAQELAEDLKRWLQGEPILARPVGRWMKAAKWVRRNPVVASLLATVALVLLAGTGVATYFAIQATDRAQEAFHYASKAKVSANQARQGEANARAEALRARRLLYVAQIRHAQRAWQDGEVDRVLELLAGQEPARTGGVDLRGFEWHYLNRLCHSELSSLLGHRPGVDSVAFSPLPRSAKVYLGACRWAGSERPRKWPRSSLSWRPQGAATSPGQRSRSMAACPPQRT
jgi:hypothetical protein